MHRITRRTHLGAHGLTLAAALALVVATACPRPAAAFITAGAEVFWVASGSVDTDREHTPEDGLPTEFSQDETSGLGVTVYGLIGVLPIVDAGLAIHYLPTFEVTDEDKTTHKLGSETDLNLRLGVTLPVPAVLLSAHGEGGLTLFSPTGDLARPPTHGMLTTLRPLATTLVSE